MREECISLIELLAKSQNNYLEALEIEPPKKLTVSPPNKWNILQVLEHISFSQQGTISYINKKKQADKIKKAGWRSSLGLLTIKLFFKYDLKIKAPSVLPQPKRENELENLKHKLQAQQKELISLANELAEEKLKAEIFKHPLAGRINFKQTCTFLKLHWLHHTKQIDNLLEQYVEEK